MFSAFQNMYTLKVVGILSQRALYKSSVAMAFERHVATHIILRSPESALGGWISKAPEGSSDSITRDTWYFTPLNKVVWSLKWLCSSQILFLLVISRLKEERSHVSLIWKLGILSWWVIGKMIPSSLDSYPDEAPTQLRLSLSRHLDKREPKELKLNSD